MRQAGQRGPWRIAARWLLAGCGAAAALAHFGPAHAALRRDDTPLSVGQAHRRTLEVSGSDRYTLDLPGESFVFGVADQISVDVVVTVYDPAGEVVGHFDAPSRGPEAFQFTTDAGGVYVIEVAPFEGATGEYELRLRGAEALATTPEGRAAQMLAPHDGSDVPGGVVAVVRQGRVAWSQAFGMASLTYDIPFSVGTRTNIGSTSKQFTAFAVALLAERGALSLDDDVRTHIPELPDLGHTVTLRHLLTHTSGYREFLNAVFMGGRRIDLGDWIDRDEIIELVRRQETLQNDPGAEWNYNNTGYGLLATVVERVGGKPFPDWMRENVFEPLGMDDTFVKSSPMQIVPGASQGYVPDPEGGFLAAYDLGGAMGAGGIYTSVEDLATWMHHYASPSVCGPGVVEAMTTEYMLPSGTGTGYGMGLMLDEQGGLRRWQHGGADTAHRSAFLYFPTLDAGVIVLTNSPMPVGGMADGVAASFFEADMSDDTSEATAPEAAIAQEAGTPDAPCTPEQFDAFAGRYALEEAAGFILRFWREEATFYVQATGQPRLEIVPTGATTFEVQGAPVLLTFHPGEDGAAQSLTLHQNGDHPARRLSDEPAPPSQEELGAFVGRYYSQELDAHYDVSLDDKGLVLRHRRLDDIRLQPGQEDRFRAASGLAWRVSAVPEAVGGVGGCDLIEDGLHRSPQSVP